MTTSTHTAFLDTLCQGVRATYAHKRSMLSFAEFFALFQENPRRFARSAVQYLLDMLHYFGTEEVDTALGPQRRFKLFDLPFAEGRFKVIGHENTQNALHDLLLSFARERRVTRLVLLHGPNGSAKSSLIHCLIAGLEHYSQQDEGALYRFNWIFPTAKVARTSIGFDQDQRQPGAARLASYAHLDEESIDAKLIEEMRDNPLLLLPRPERQELLRKHFGERCRTVPPVPLLPDAEAPFVVSDYLYDGDISHKSRMVFDALLASYQGDLQEVFRHIQIERFYISRRYRQGAVTIEPQLRVDAGSRQVTADRSLSALPTALQNRTIFEPFGDLVDGNRGLVEFNDILKRPPELNKYLIATSEKGSVNVDHAILFLDTVLIGTCNEDYLEAFKVQPDYPSFKGRLDLLRMPYLLDHEAEKGIYDEMLANTDLSRHVAPHTTAVAALWAVLTRMMRPNSEGAPESITPTLEKLTPLEKADLYASGRVPEGLSGEQVRELKAWIFRLREEAAETLHYEGRHGISPREIKQVILHAAQNAAFGCLSPLALFDAFANLIKDPSVHPFLRVEADPPYHDPKGYSDAVERRYLDLLDFQIRDAMGLVEKENYASTFALYVTSVSNFLKGEKIYDRITGAYQEPSPAFMDEVESLIGINDDPRKFREDLIATIAAYRIDNPDAELDYRRIFPEAFSRMEDRFFQARRSIVQKRKDDIIRLINGLAADMTPGDRDDAQRSLDTLKTRYGFCEQCALEALVFLHRKRYS